MSTRDSVRPGGSGAEDGPAPLEGVAPAEGLAAPEALVRGPPTPTREVEVSRPAGGPDGAEARPAPGVDLVWLQVEVQKASQAAGQERRQLADTINEAFARLGRARGSRMVADFLLRQLESGALRDLVDSDGRTCRAAATGALLAMGYPYALEVSPEDLEHLRKDTASGRAVLTPRAVAGLGVASLGGLFELLRLVLNPQGDVLLSSAGMAQVAVAIAAAAVAATSRPGTPGRGMSLAALLMAGPIGLGLYLVGLGEPALVGGLATLVAWVLLALRR